MYGNSKFVVLEIQKGDTVTTIVNSYDTLNQANQQYHTILAAAAVSSVPVHSAIILTEDATPVKYESYTHLPEPDSDPEPEE